MDIFVLISGFSFALIIGNLLKKIEILQGIYGVCGRQPHSSFEVMLGSELNLAVDLCK